MFFIIVALKNFAIFTGKEQYYFLALLLTLIPQFHSVFIVQFEQVNAGCVQNMYISCWLKKKILATAETKTGVTLHKVKHQNNVEVALVLCWLSLNFYLASISFATLSMYFVYWFNFAKVKTIVFAFIRNSRET